MPGITQKELQHILEQPVEVDPYALFNEEKKKFLEKSIGIFYDAYVKTHSEEYQKLYRRLMRERQNCRV